MQRFRQRSGEGGLAGAGFALAEQRSSHAQRQVRGRRDAFVGEVAGGLERLCQFRRRSDTRRGIAHVREPRSVTVSPVPRGVAWSPGGNCRVIVGSVIPLPRAWLLASAMLVRYRGRADRGHRVDAAGQGHDPAGRRDRARRRCAQRDRDAADPVIGATLGDDAGRVHPGHRARVVRSARRDPGGPRCLSSRTGERIAIAAPWGGIPAQGAGDDRCRPRHAARRADPAAMLPTFTGDFPAQPDPVRPQAAEPEPAIAEESPSEPLPAPAQPVAVPGSYQYLKRWTFVPRRGRGVDRRGR